MLFQEQQRAAKQAKKDAEVCSFGRHEASYTVWFGGGDVFRVQSMLTLESNQNAALIQ